ncbi:PREDICTED: phosphoglycerate mutase-like protein 1 isoform X1 [Ipomoea nil]|uniref:phosphoglycerate mutase-like protein 1 isoform X1 n=1 Tax=Ipomoea nil TaxID=35883 RepID=UPI000900AF24|nr:PREDICTED: phosphoglycerate mutase-like protein 1 isoform X1 [Ipomoea nil]
MTDSVANCLLYFQFGKVQFLFRNYSDSTAIALTPNLRSRTSTHLHLQLRRSSSPVVSLPSRSRSAASRCSSSLFSVSDMDASGGQSVYPLHRCKTIHLVRHAQGFHNVEGEKDNNAYLLPHLFDANLTPLGWQQVDNLRKHVNSSGLSKRVELVVTSPLLRTIQTAVGVFGGEGYADDIQGLPLMVTNAGNSSRPAISSLNCPPFLAMELCREHTGVHWCDKRRNISEYKPQFPAIDFSLIEHNDDILWKEDIRETDEELATRGMKFLNWLLTRKEKEIAVVTHSGFLIHTLRQFGNDCNPNVKNEICRPFNNCELRSMVIVDRCMIGSDTPTTDYPGKIPSGSDVPSE